MIATGHASCPTLCSFDAWTRPTDGESKHPHHERSTRTHQSTTTHHPAATGIFTPPRGAIVERHPMTLNGKPPMTNCSASHLIIPIKDYRNWHDVTQAISMAQQPLRHGHYLSFPLSNPDGIFTPLPTSLAPCSLQQLPLVGMSPSRNTGCCTLVHRGGGQLTTTMADSCSLYAYTANDELASHILKHSAWPESGSTGYRTKKKG